MGGAEGTRIGGYGGVLREERGHWVLGLLGRLKDCTSVEAELWGLFRGLELIHSQRMEPLEIELDSTVVVAPINEEHPETFTTSHVFNQGM